MPLRLHLRLLRGVSTAAPTTQGVQPCWKCHAPLPAKAAALFCPEPACGVIQPLAPQHVNHYALFSLPPPRAALTLDLPRLEAAFRATQRLLHPDKFATRSAEERRISQENSSLVNQAYQVLRSRQERANYVLSTFHDIRVLEEGGTYSDTALMTEVFALREQVEEVAGPAEARALLAEQDARLDALAAQLEDALKAGQRAQATALAVRMKYLSKVVDELAEKAEE